MKTYHSLTENRLILTSIYSSVLSTVVLLTAGTAFAQEGRFSPAQVAILGVIALVLLVIFAALYVYTSLALQTIAKKTNTQDAWLAWIPIAHLLLMLNIAKKPLWWFVLFLIPLVNIVIAVIVWMAIAEARGKPNWWGILLLVPVAGIIVPGYLAWSD